MSKTKIVNAWTMTGSIRVALPIEQIEECPAGHREIDDGVSRIGLHIGRKWLVVHNYSIWVNRHDRNGQCFGDVYWAYNRDDPGEVRLFMEHYWKTRHHTDFITGNSACMNHLFPKEED